MNVIWMFIKVAYFSIKNVSYFPKAMEIAFLSPSGYSSLEKKSKLESIAFRLSCEGFFVDVLNDVCQEGALLPMSLIFGDSWD